MSSKGLRQKTWRWVIDRVKVDRFSFDRIYHSKFCLRLCRNQMKSLNHLKFFFFKDKDKNRWRMRRDQIDLEAILRKWLCHMNRLSDITQNVCMHFEYDHIFGDGARYLDLNAKSHSAEDKSKIENSHF